MNIGAVLVSVIVPVAVVNAKSGMTILLLGLTFSVSRVTRSVEALEPIVM